MSRIIPYNKLMYGETKVVLAYESGSPINKVYYGEDLALVRFSEYPHLNLSADVLEFPTAGGVQTVTITSNATWSASTTAPWLTVVTAATGITITASENTTEVDRDTTITITAWNADAIITTSITINQPYVIVHYLAYVYRNAGAVDNASYSITTPIYPAADCEIRIKYMARGVLCDRIAGVTHADRTDGSDAKDFRLFNYASGSIDVGNNRASYIGLNYTNGNVWDLTFGNRWVWNNDSNSYMSSPAGPYTMDASDTLIHVDVGAIAVASLQIKNGGVVVFDGLAAQDPNTQKYGLWDSVTQQLYTNDNIVMTGDEL